VAVLRRDFIPRRIALYLDAARGLRLRQVLWRARRLVPLSLLAVGIRPGPEVSVRLVAAGLGRTPAPQGGPTAPAHDTGVFAGYGVSRRFGQRGFWEDQQDGLLFLFHLHGFSALGEYAAGGRTPEGDAFWARVIESWLAEHNQPRHPAWHPYPTSLRIIAWSAALSAVQTWSAALRNELATAIVRQARYLRRSIEHDVGGNHVLKNGTALVFAGGLFPDSGLMRRGLRLLERQLAAQILPDGGHAERSTAYQREIVTDLAEVRQLLSRVGRSVPHWLDDSLARMQHWLAVVSGPDRRLPLLNDAWEGPLVDVGNVSETTHLQETGYLVLRHGRDQLLFDAGPLCPPDLPPHAHADALSIVLWADGRQVVVDPGSYAYSGDARERFRSTAAHNTVEVDASDQCVFWGDFRASYLPGVAPAELVRHDELILVASRHDGYRRLREPVDHERRIVWWPDWGVVILDRLLGEGAHDVTSRLHCSPDAAPVSVDRVGPFEIRALGGAAPEVRDGLHSPYLGTAVRAPVIELKLEARPGHVFGWSLLRSGAHVVAVSEAALVLERQGERLHAPTFAAKGP
jgi:hypothetical protein